MADLCRVRFKVFARIGKTDKPVLVQTAGFMEKKNDWAA